MIAYLLAAGRGSRMAPYDEVRPKTLLPVVNRPVISHLLDALAGLPCREVRVAAHHGVGDIRRAVPDAIRVVDVGLTNGTAETLSAIHSDDEPALVFPGDVLVDAGDVGSLAAAAAPDTVHLLLAPIPDGETRDWIGVRHDGEAVTAIVGHPRGGVTHRIAGYALPAGFGRWLERTPSHFPAVQVGMMPPAERYLEAAVELWRADGRPVVPVVAQHPSFDLDKPWQVLAANHMWLRRMAADVRENRLAAGASIDDTALVSGPVVLGRNSRIGRNVIVRGTLIAGDDVLIDAGAIIDGTTAIGDGTRVVNGCYVDDGTVIGPSCVIGHAAEVSGVLFDGVYLYHYMEIFGMIGTRTDIGAATVCGSLRFDDGPTTYRVRGRREIPRDFSNACYVGDYCRTGVNAILMPGCRIGPYSIVGPGVVLDRDLPPRTGVRVRQELEEHPWGPERYGW
jgi:UDP-N-acetylglucosamine diphosphorylase / glucose-1-phosphate thymidylyltransferase / UDP-N-acetylgalactosamine diphosphorylase / glucosamine-1-phosphate N-acetyltransferase / galactosamine-1-phosphate N-acetyltransferase